MPIYTYKCEQCGKKKDIKHSIEEEIVLCSEAEQFDCSENSKVKRVDFLENTIEVDVGKEKEEKPREDGELVEKKIEEFKEEKSRMEEEYKGREADIQELEEGE